MRTLCTRTRIKSGAVEEVREWFQILKERLSETMQTLEAEGVLIESAFLDKYNDDYYLIYYLKAEDIDHVKKIFKESKFPIDQFVGNDRVRGLVTRMMTCSRLAMEDQVLADLDEFKAINPNIPKLEFSKDKIIIRNTPKCHCFKEIVKAFFVSCEMCEKDADIIELDSGIMIIKKKTCNCGCNKKTEEPEKPPGDKIENCKWWCDKNALLAMAWCAKVFKGYICQACILAVELIKDGCHWCCKTGDFFNRYVKPFGDILSQMDELCEPYLD